MKIKSLTIILPCVIILTFILANMSGCNAAENITQSAARLLIQTITGTDLEGTEGSSTVFSDVITLDGVFNDTAVANLSAVLLDPGQVTGTHYHDIIVDQVDIRYTRADMPDPVEGRDVPYSFSQKVFLRIPIGIEAELGFVLVQHTAKLESPLVELTSVGQEMILKMEAHITFYSVDGGGKRLEPVTGVISVWFSNFGPYE